MRILITILLTCAALSASETQPVPWPAVRFALGQIESGDDDRARGAVGEVSRYQIRPELWREYARPGESPTHPAHAWRVARSILAPRLASVIKARVPLTPERVYLLWNAPAALARADYQINRLSPVLRDRADRFGNLVRDHNQRTK